jgi:hypothetical protein
LTTFEASTPAQRIARARDDLRRLEGLCAAAAVFERELTEADALWARDDETPLSPGEREAALRLFDRAFDLQVAAHTITRFHHGVLALDPADDPVGHALHFGLAHRAYFRRLSVGMEVCRRAQNRPQFEVLLDEGEPTLGLRPGLWTRFKDNVLAVEHVARAAAAYEHQRELAELLQHVDAPPPVAALLAGLDDDWAQLGPRLYDDAPRLLLGNAFDALRDAGHALLLPVATEVAGWLGDTRVYNEGKSNLSGPQRTEAARRSRPGDVIFERRDWYLSNLGLPGFWPHAALWVGTPSELSAALDHDPAVRAAYGGRFTDALRRRFPEAWESYVSPDAEGHPRRVIEAVSEGVVFSSADHTLRADYAAALRPRRAPRDVARALEQAFAYWGRPYDFDFDFYSDRALVCSELVYKAWEPREGLRGIAFPLVSRLGRMNLSPNDMVAWWAAQADEPDAPLAFAWFLDGREATGTAEWEDEAALRRSAERPKWSLDLG